MSAQERGGVTFAVVSGSLEENDLIHGITLPNVPDQHPDLNHHKREYAQPDLEQADFTHAPVRFNHKTHMNTVGVTIAWRSQRQNGDSVRVETLHKLNAEPRTFIETTEALLQRDQRNLLMEGVHRGLSLCHKFETEYLPSNGVYQASLPSGTADTGGILVEKTILEISTCKAGRRKGSHIIDYLPCRRSLDRSAEHSVREFASIYNYTKAAPNLAGDSWRSYIDQLWSEVSDRRRRILSEPGYVEKLRANGVVAASETDVDTADASSIPVPWIFVTETIDNATTAGTKETMSGTTPTPVSTTATPSATTAAAAATTSTAAAPTNTAAATTTSMMPVDPTTVRETAPPGMDHSEQAARNYQAFVREQEHNAMLAARLKEFQDREDKRAQEEHNSRKRKMQEDADAKKAEFEQQKKILQAALNAQVEKILASGMPLDPVLAERDQAALDNAGDEAQLNAEKERMNPYWANMVQASERAMEAKSMQERFEAEFQQRSIQSQSARLATQFAQFMQPASSSIATSGGIPQNQRAASTTMLPSAGIVSASATSRSVVPIAASTPATPAQPAAPAVDMSADDRYSQALQAHLILSNGTTLPSRHELLHGSYVEQTRVMNSANGQTYEEKFFAPRLQQANNVRDYCYKTAAPEFHEALVKGIREALSNTSTRVPVNEINQMNVHGKMDPNTNVAVNLIPFGGPLPQDGWMYAGSHQGFGGSFAWGSGR